MRWMPPHIDVPGDNEDVIPYPRDHGYVEGADFKQPEIRPNIMGRSGEFLGGNDMYGVWRYGFSDGSEAGLAYGVSLPTDHPGFLWVLATRRTGHISATFEGFAVELPKRFRQVIDQ